MASAVDGAAVVIGHLRAGLEPEDWASSGPSGLAKPNVNRPVRSRYATNERAPEPGWPGEKCSRPIIFADWLACQMVETRADSPLRHRSPPTLRPADMSLVSRQLPAAGANLTAHLPPPVL